MKAPASYDIRKYRRFGIATTDLLRSMENRIADGDENSFYPDSGNKRADLTYKPGQIEGPAVAYAPDGKTVIQKYTSVQSLKSGVEEQFDAVKARRCCMRNG